MLGVVLRAQVALLIRAIRARPLTGIMHPANDVIVVFLFANAAQVCGKCAANKVRALAGGMARQTPARFEQNLAVRCVAGLLLLQRRPGEAGLPDKGGNGLNLGRAEAKLRHLGGRAELVRMADPIGNPFLAQLHADFLQVRPDLLDLLEEVMAAPLKLFCLAIELADCDGQVGGLGIVVIGRGIVRGLVAEFLKAGNVELVLLLVRRKLENLLTGADKLLVLVIETLETMTPNAALQTVELFALVEHGGMLGDHIRGMALLAAGVVVLRIVERPEPVFVASMASLGRV